MADQQPVVEQILSVNPGQVFVDLDDITCPGKIGLAISYPTHDDRMAIERIINGDLFFGIPYQLRNQ